MFPKTSDSRSCTGAPQIVLEVRHGHTVHSGKPCWGTPASPHPFRELENPTPPLVTEQRTRAAVERLADHQYNGSGQRLRREAGQLLDSERARMRVGQVAVPFGICTEPSNVQAGGGACPYRLRCLGCGHFRTDASYLPELRAYLDRLLADRERVLAATDLDDRAKTEAAPSTTEISKVRQFIHRLEHDLDDLTDEEHQQIRDACAALRKTRQVVHLGQPHRPTLHRGRPGDRQDRVTATTPLAEARARDTTLRHQRVLTALEHIVRTGAEITISSVARTARVHRSFIHRHPDLHAAVTAAHHDPEPLGHPVAVSTASLRAEVANLQAQNTRLVRHIATLEHRLSDTLGIAVYQASGIGAPDDTTQLEHRITELEQHLLEVRQQLDERTDDLTAARAANRELMTELNRRQAT